MAHKYRAHQLPASGWWLGVIQLLFNWLAGICSHKRLARFAN